MTEIDVVRYMKGDALSLASRQIEWNGQDEVFLQNESFTGLVGERPVFCCGLIHYWPGNAELWLILGLPAVYLDAFRKIQMLLEWMIQKHKLFRVNARCLSEWSEANRSIRHLGFTHEATLPCYGPNRETYNQYGKVLWRS